VSINVKVPWETRLGDIGESEIKTRLSHFSIPTKYTRDVGIDFYCELLEDDSPSTPFYIQAKGSEHFDDSWAQNIKKSTIVYWLLQPFPVFLVVYDNNDGNCYWMSIEDYRYSIIEKLHKTDSDSLYIVMDRSRVLEKGKNDEFVRKVKEDFVSIELFRGRPQFKGEGYLRTVPDPPRSEFEHTQIKENIRQSMYALVIHHLRHDDLKEAYFYCDFLTKFDQSHYNHFVWFGQINKALGKKDEAKRSYEEALKICRRDPNWPKESMKKIIEYIEQEAKSCE
jgi:tetratricopeptide (TPR) repeat protein